MVTTNRDAHEHQLEMGLLWAQTEVTQINRQNGWFDADRTFGDDIALLHSEVSEALEAFRTWGTEDQTHNVCGISKGSDHANLEKPCKPEGVGSELADVLVRLLDTCERYDIDLGLEFIRKIKYNATRGYRHGNKGL